MNDQEFHDIAKISTAVQLAKEGDHPMIALNTGETERFEDTHPSPHHFAPTIASCIYGGTPYVMGHFDTQTPRARRCTRPYLLKTMLYSTAPKSLKGTRSCTKAVSRFTHTI